MKQTDREFSQTTRFMLLLLLQFLASKHPDISAELRGDLLFIREGLGSDQVDPAVIAAIDDLVLFLAASIRDPSSAPLSGERKYPDWLRGVIDGGKDWGLDSCHRFTGFREAETGRFSLCHLAPDKSLR